MKTVTIVGAKEARASTCLLNLKKQDYVVNGDDNMSVSDGYHTFEELYEHRIELYITLCRLLASNYKLQVDGEGVWRSLLHSDGTAMEGWFVLGILTVKGQQITYHLPLSRWDETSFAKTLDKAPEFDGHTSDDVLKRLKSL